MTREERAAEAAAMVESARADGLWIRWAGVDEDTLWTARQFTIDHCQDARCGRPFLAVTTSQQPVLYCSLTCARRVSLRRKRKNRLNAVALPPPPAVVAEDPNREANCPRPDKIWWHTKEAADQIVTMMRRSRRPRASDLRAYLCDEGGPTGHGCGAYHVGDRTRHAGDPVVVRWGSAAEREG